jgi:alkylresorcinol/alkylpyrone synthase
MGLRPAAAVILVGAERPSSGPAILGTRSVFYPDSEDIMGWDISEEGFRIVLSARLPELIQQCLAADVDRSRRFWSEPQHIGNWVIHTGGPKILEAVERALGLSDRDLRLSWECLRRHGNIVSQRQSCSCWKRPSTLIGRPRVRSFCSWRWARVFAPN